MWLLVLALVFTGLAGAAPRQVLWHDPGPVEKLNFFGGPGGRAGAPVPPFTFIDEDLNGTAPKVRVRDGQKRQWVVKWGSEVHADIFASRMAWAAGYFVSPTYFVESGTIRGAHGLTRARKWIKSDGSFTTARFKLHDKHVKRVKGHDWAWINNPFLGTRELAGLKIMLMLTSNWDSKDARNVEDHGSNTGIFHAKSRGKPELRYSFTDWGGSMGTWHFAIEHNWNCSAYTAETADLIKGVSNGVVQWGYHGQQAKDVTSGITVDDVRWLLQYVGRITDAQIHAGLKAAGAAPEEEECFAKAVRERIERLKQLAYRPNTPITQ